jgi:hypothetical protein
MAFFDKILMYRFLFLETRDIIFIQDSTGAKAHFLPPRREYGNVRIQGRPGGGTCPKPRSKAAASDIAPRRPI